MNRRESKQGAEPQRWRFTTNIYSNVLQEVKSYLGGSLPMVIQEKKESFYQLQPGYKRTREEFCLTVKACGRICAS